MAQKIVGTFDKELKNIEFYTIVDNYKHFTIIRRAGRDEYFAWDNKNSLFSDNLHIIAIPDNKEKYEKILDHVQTWYMGAVFFWADSKFVTQHGLPNYDKLIGLYKELLNIKGTEIQIKNTLQSVKEQEGFVSYLKCLFHSLSFLRAQRKTIRRLEKEFKLIW